MRLINGPFGTFDLDEDFSIKRKEEVKVDFRLSNEDIINNTITIEVKDKNMNSWKVVEEKHPIIVKMATTNEKGYNFDKTIEELFELGEKLMKRKLKDGWNKAPTDEEIIDEIGDVQIRIDVLKELFGADKVERRIEYKLDKFKDYYEKNMYIGRI